MVVSVLVPLPAFPEPLSQFQPAGAALSHGRPPAQMTEIMAKTQLQIARIFAKRVRDSRSVAAMTRMVAAPLKWTPLPRKAKTVRGDWPIRESSCDPPLRSRSIGRRQVSLASHGLQTKTRRHCTVLAQRNVTCRIDRFIFVTISEDDSY